MQITIAEAKAHLSEIIRRAEDGEEIVLTRHGRPAVRLIPAGAQPSRGLIGALAGQIEIAEDFDDLPEEMLEALRGDAS